jgi:hypothetical protein
MGSDSRMQTVRGTSKAPRVLLGSAAIGCVAGVLVPGWWIDEVYGDSYALRNATAALLGVVLVGTLVAAGLARRPWRGVGIVALDVCISVVTFFTTWFFFGPSAAVAAWLIIAGVVLWPDSPAIRRRIVTAGCITGGVSTLASSGVLHHLVDPPTVIARVLNVCCVLYLVYLAIRTVRAGGRPAGA